MLSPTPEVPVLWTVASPLERCPLFEYCLIDVILRQRPSIVIDARWRRKETLLSQPALQRDLQFAYEPIPLQWKERRGYPYFLTQFVCDLVRTRLPGTPVRLLLLHSPEDSWWIDALVGQVRAELIDLQWEPIRTEGGSDGEFCVKDRCPLGKRLTLWSLGEFSPTVREEASEG